MVRVSISLDALTVMLVTGASSSLLGWLCVEGIPSTATRVDQYISGGNLILVYGEPSLTDEDILLEARYVSMFGSPELRTPEEWNDDPTVSNYIVIDPDGWRRGCALGEKSWDVPITREEFMARQRTSTIGPRSKK